MSLQEQSQSLSENTKGASRVTTASLARTVAALEARVVAIEHELARAARSARLTAARIEAVEAELARGAAVRAAEALAREALARDVAQLKHNSSVRCRTAVAEALSRAAPPREMDTWMDALAVSPQHLTLVFSSGIMAGIKMCVCDAIAEHALEESPMRAFRQKTTMIYVFASPEADPDLALKPPAWRAMTSAEIDRLAGRVAIKFVRAFVAWQEDNAALINTGRITNDLVVEYMSRVYGFARLPRDKVRADLRRAIFDAAAQDLAPPKGGEAPISSA